MQIPRSPRVGSDVRIILTVTASSLVFLAALGALSAGAGGASRWRGALRVTFWGALAMALTALVGRVFGTVV
ncbi:MAG TPA: VIT1/CCC1 transporter family protein [Gemmatimonadales bacterium]